MWDECLAATATPVEPPLGSERRDLESLVRMTARSRGRRDSSAELGALVLLDFSDRRHFLSPSRADA